MLELTLILTGCPLSRPRKNRVVRTDSQHLRTLCLRQVKLTGPAWSCSGSSLHSTAAVDHVVTNGLGSLRPANVLERHAESLAEKM